MTVALSQINLRKEIIILWDVNANTGNKGTSDNSK